MKYSETCHRTVILSYLVGPTILICNLDVLKNATPSGEGPREAVWGGRSYNGPKSTVVTFSFPVLLSLERRSAYQLPAQASVQEEGLIK